MKRIWVVLAIVLVLSLIAPMAQAYDPKPPGDVNGDDQVNENDFYILRDVYLGRIGTVRWDARADLNKDGIINCLDFSIIAANWYKW